jgi:hypothetical protein
MGPRQRCELTACSVTATVHNGHVPRIRINALTGLTLTAFAVGTGVALSATAPPTEVYKWTDDKGVVHYGDSVPPEYAQKERVLLNRQGVEVGRVEGGKSAAQQAEQQRAEDLARQKQQHDQFLLSTYGSTKDIEQLRDQRLAQIDGQIKAASLYIDSLDTRLAALVERARGFKPYSETASARRMPDDLAEELVRAANENRAQHGVLDAKRKEMVDVRAQFDADVTRFRELTVRQRGAG